MVEGGLIEEAANLISRARYLVAFSGSGMSEESGIPTFRDPGGLWDRYDPYELGGGDVFSGFMGGGGPPAEAVAFVSEMVAVMEKAYPNPGHQALVELEKMGILQSVITQNIDNLHREAGNSKVIEVHGNVFRLACLGCGSKALLGREEFLEAGKKLVELLGRADVAGVLELATRCPCGGISRPDVVGFGEPVQDMPPAIKEARNADVFLILGTSGTVYPAASLPDHAKRAGAKLIEINATGCYFGDLVDIGIIAKTGEVLPLIVERVKELHG
jgi:NAD-dependent deacetylase